LANGLNVTRAAQQVHATQPGVTKHIRQLEDEFGCRLFVRQKNRFVALTEQGEHLLPIALRLLATADELEGAARELRSRGRRTLTIAASPTPARFYLPDVVREFSMRHSKTRVRIVEGSSAQSVERLLRGEADLCLSSRPSERRTDLTFSPCYELHWLLLVPRNHALLRLSRLTLAAVAAYPLITYEQRFASRVAIVEAFRARGLVPNVAHEAPDSDIMRRYVLSGLGVAFIAGPGAAEFDDDGLVTLDAGKLVPPIVIHVGQRKDEALNPEATALLRMIRAARPRE
jgi:LysR family transcriptional regulator, cys regulon transcriptional activator